MACRKVTWGQEQISKAGKGVAPSEGCGAALRAQRVSFLVEDRVSYHHCTASEPLTGSTVVHTRSKLWQYHLFFLAQCHTYLPTAVTAV